MKVNFQDGTCFSSSPDTRTPNQAKQKPDIEILNLEQSPSTASPLLQKALEHDLDRISVKSSPYSPTFRRKRAKSGLAPSPLAVKSSVEEKYLVADCGEDVKKGTYRCKTTKIIPVDSSTDVGTKEKRAMKLKESFLSKDGWAAKARESLGAVRTEGLLSKDGWAAKARESLGAVRTRSFRPTTSSSKAAPPPLQRAKSHRLSVLLEESKEVFMEETFPDYFLHPDSLFFKNSHLFSAIGVVYVCTALPLRMGFGIPSSWASVVINLFLDLFFLVDVGLAFRTAYVDPKTKMMVADPGLVARRYLKGWFAVDFLSSLPISALSLITKSVEDYIFFKIFRFLKY